MPKRKSKSKSGPAIDAGVFERFTQPVDADLFLWCTNIYGAAASMKMPTKNPEEFKVGIGEDVYAMTDQPLNRGMLAVMEQLKERGIDQDARMSMGFRLMHFAEVLEAPSLAKFRRTCDEPDAIEIAEALIRACASARLEQSADHMGFDLADVERIADDLWNQDEGMRL